jgi:hypothetical protein
MGEKTAHPYHLRSRVQVLQNYGKGGFQPKFLAVFSV